MALRYRVAKEDALLGLFIAFALFYPFFVTFLIWYKDYSMRKESLKELKPFVSFITGSGDCNEEPIKSMLSQDVIKRYSLYTLKDLCLRNKKEDYALEEESVSIKDREVNFYGVYRGKSDNNLYVRIKAEKADDGLVIKSFSYEKGH